MKKIIVIAFLVLFSASAQAQNTVEELVKPVLELIHNGEHKNLVSKVFPDGSPMREYISGADIKQLDTEFESYLRTMGKSHGYHLYHVSDVENIYEIRYYLFKFDRQPIIAKFEVYKPKDKWRLQGFNIDFSLDKYMEESAKKRLGALGIHDLRKKIEANKTN